MAKVVYLVFGLHMYQPPTQSPEVLEKIKRESYAPLLRFILEHPRAYFNVDICGSLLELAQNYGHIDFLELLRANYAIHKINLVSSGCYHPIFPLISPEMIQRQIKLNNEEFRKVFGGLANYQKPMGVFPPEMAFSPDITESLKNTGALWTITEDVGYYDFYREAPPFDKIIKHNDISIFLRSNLWSCKISFDKPDGQNLANDLKRGMKNWFGNKDGYLCVWMDFETFGHHHGDLIGRFMKPFLDNLGDEIILTSPENLLSKFEFRERIVPPCSWSTNLEDFQHRNYFPMWDHPSNDFHKIWWRLQKTVYEIIKENPQLLPIYDKALYSCQTWQYYVGNKQLAGLGLPYFREIVGNTGHPLKGEAINYIRILEKMVSH